MFELDKQQFGAFLAEQRRQKQLTQKELAQKLYISDKAVSKWERGLNMPDITLLVPLAKALDVSVTELLECRRIPQSEPMSPNQVEALVKKAITMTEEDPQLKKQRRQKNGWLYFICLLTAVGQMGLLLSFQLLPPSLSKSLGLMVLLNAIFGFYFCLIVKQKLPAYYDENPISSYSDGIFRMNLAGVHFNNRNWPHIIQMARNWSLIMLVLMPLLHWVLAPLSRNSAWIVIWVPLLIYLGGLLVPMIYVGKKYE